MNKISVKAKSALMEEAREKLQLQIRQIEDQLGELIKAGAEEGKSSAGDKYETQREMIKQSRDLLDIQLYRTQMMLNQLKQISTRAQSSVQEGALIKLSIGYVWVCVSLGESVLEGEKYQLISKDSPLFLSLKNKKIGESVLFRGKNLVIEELI